MENEFKKKDAKGNQLPEEIGKGINYDHLEKVMAERAIKDSILTLKIENELHNRLIAKAEQMDVPKSFIVRELICNFLDK